MNLHVYAQLASWDECHQLVTICMIDCGRMNAALEAIRHKLVSTLGMSLQVEASVDIRWARIIVCLQAILWLCQAWLERALDL